MFGMEQNREMKNWFDNGDTTGQWGTNTRGQKTTITGWF